MSFFYAYRLMKDPNIEIDQITYTFTTVALEGTKNNTKNLKVHKCYNTHSDDVPVQEDSKLFIINETEITNSLYKWLFKYSYERHQ